MTRKSSSSFSALSRGSVLLRRELASSMSFWACSRLFQKLSAAMRASSSFRRFCAAGTSKKPPQVVQLVGGGRQFGCNGVEHRGKIDCPRRRGKRKWGRAAFRNLDLELPSFSKNRTAADEQWRYERLSVTLHCWSASEASNAAPAAGEAGRGRAAFC